MPRRNPESKTLQSPMSSDKQSVGFAFLTVRHSEQVGYFGGLLTINSLGRPMEFHCSLPIKPTRAQTILYGYTLTDFLVGEQIGHAIVSKIKLAPLLIFTDVNAVLTLRRINSIPMAYVDFEDESSLAKPTSSQAFTLSSGNLMDYELGTLSEFESDIKQINQIWNQHSPQFSLAEPFARIVEALREANPSSKAA
jgi:hypothetical protein